MISLADKVYLFLIKMEMTISVNTATVQKIVNLCNNVSPNKAILSQMSNMKEDLLEGRAVGVMKVTKGAVCSGGNVGNVVINS